MKMEFERKGPWDKEDDRWLWADPETNTICEVIRTRLGYWTGYVKTFDHPLAGFDLLDRDCSNPVRFINVHGGITFTDTITTRTNGIIEYVVGFDCGHDLDDVPALEAYEDSVYRTQEYAIEQTTKLAKAMYELRCRYYMDPYVACEGCEECMY